jgi:phosphoribosylcarboxyaminoimidazole (NCAIR) mutase
MEHVRGIKISYGADLADGRLLLVRCVRGRADDACETLYDGPAAERIAESIATAGISSSAQLSRHDVVLAGVMSAQESFARWIHTPLNAPEKALRVLPSLLDVQIPFPLEICEHTVAAVQRAENRAVDLLAVAARREDVRQRLSEYEKAALDPEILDHEGLALWTQSLREAPLERGAARIVAYVGLDHSTLVVGHGTDQGFTGAHGVRIGFKQLLDRQAGDEAARQFAVRAQQVTRAQIPGRISKDSLQWFWTGPGAEEPDAIQSLENVLQNLGPPVFRTHAKAPAFLARALAIRALGGAPLPCNLRGKSTAHPKTASRISALHRRTVQWLSAAGIALCVAGMTWQGILQARDHEIQTELTRTAQSLSGLQQVPKGQELLVTRRALKDQADHYKPFLAFFRPSQADLLARVLQKCTQLGIRIESLSLRPESAAIMGSATDWNHCDAAAAILRKAGYIIEIERQDAGADERVHFSIKARRGGEERGS